MASDDRLDRWERWVRDALGNERLEHVSPEGLQRALSRGRQLRDRRAKRPGWSFELIFDSAATPLVQGVRGGATHERRLLYSLHPADAVGDDHRLDLQVRRGPSGDLELMGQLLPPWERARVRIRCGRNVRRSDVGRLGEFVFDGLSGAARTLEIRISDAGGRDVVIPDISLATDENEDG